MQNKANFRKVKLNVTKVLTKDYENKPYFWPKPEQTQNKANTNPIHHSVASGEAGTKPIYRSVAPAEVGTIPASKRRKITCFGISYPYNYWFGINIGDFLCVNNAAVVVLKLKQPSKTR